MQKYSIMILLFALLSCKKENEMKNEHIFNQVLLVLNDENYSNILEVQGGSDIMNDLNLFYIDYKGERILQNKSSQDLPKNMEVVKIDETQGSVLKILVNLVPKTDGYAESVLVIEGYSEVSINVKTEISDGHGMSGSKGYSQILINGEKVSADLLGKPISVKLKK